MAQWSTAVAIPNQTTKTSPALAYLNGTLHMLHLGSSSDNIWYSYYDRGQWRPNVQTGLRSRGPVAFAAGPEFSNVGNDYGMMVYRSFEQAPDGGYGFLHSLSRGGNDPWLPAGLLPGKFTSEHPPALTVDRGGHWMLGSVITGSRSIRVARYAASFSGTPAVLVGDEVVQNQSTKTTPALALYIGQMHLLHLGGGSNDIWHSIDFAPNVRIRDQTSKATPAMAVYKNVLHMVHLGSGSESLWHTTYTPQSGWTPNVRIPGQSSSAYPALATTPDALHIVYKGADSGRIWHSIYR